MNTIDDYLDAAIINEKLRSDRALSVKLGLSPGSVNHFRTKKAWPSDNTMIKIASLANMDETEALLSLNIWRNMDGAAAPLYSRLMDKLKAAAMLGIAMFFIIAAFSGTSTPAHADQLHGVFNGIYYDK
ncbi:hypothetical protein [Thalassospira sp. TSL5-1]|uniref:hypothetical protein n=1 Tax=Thalassospira sp. TSL5-1 TaxID=1544451 RepID=UPI00093E18D8|nr:hypothetical protein [Thalassospira sp. TSL5-1]OKH89941.1 hypothetical protein LF95_08650 [Thalassospira sp. TSL5-1]